MHWFHGSDFMCACQLVPRCQVGAKKSVNLLGGYRDVAHPGEDGPRLSPFPRAGLQPPPLRGEAGEKQLVIQSSPALSALTVVWGRHLSQLSSSRQPQADIKKGDLRPFPLPSRLGRFGNTRWLLHHCGWISFYSHLASNMHQALHYDLMRGSYSTKQVYRMFIFLQEWIGKIFLLRWRNPNQVLNLNRQTVWGFSWLCFQHPHQVKSPFLLHLFTLWIPHFCPPSPTDSLTSLSWSKTKLQRKLPTPSISWSPNSTPFPCWCFFFWK